MRAYTRAPSIGRARPSSRADLRAVSSAEAWGLRTSAPRPRPPARRPGHNREPMAQREALRDQLGTVADGRRKRRDEKQEALDRRRDERRQRTRTAGATSWPLQPPPPVDHGVLVLKQQLHPHCRWRHQDVEKAGAFSARFAGRPVSTWAIE